jgi:hypothetical protein
MIWRSIVVTVKTEAQIDIWPKYRKHGSNGQHKLICTVESGSMKQWAGRTSNRVRAIDMWMKSEVQIVLLTCRSVPD